METGTTKRTLTAPRRRPQVKRGDDPTATPVKILLFGSWGSGKTYAIVGLLLQGFKVLVITTDVGGSGTITVKLALRQTGREDLLQNLYEVDLKDDDEVQAFIEEPSQFFPEVYEIGIDWLFWDGFTTWQTGGLYKEIGKLPIRSSVESKFLQPAVEEGLFFEQAQWGMMRVKTMDTLHSFLSLHNKKTGQIWHKIVTTQEEIKSKGDKSGGFIETKSPFIQGGSKFLAGAGFDLILRTKENKAEKKYLYIVNKETAVSKKRGFILDDIEPGDFSALWLKLEGQLKLERKATDLNKIKPVLVSPDNLG